MRVVVIGAGPTGLCALRHLADKPELYEPMAFEKLDTVGGMWVYSDTTDFDENGHITNSNLYKTMKTNLPKEMMAFPDMPYPSDLPCFVHHTDVLQYMKDYTQKFDLQKYIQFRTVVECVTPKVSETGVQWDVTVRSVDDKENQVKHIKASAVMVCNGHYSKPFIPELPGISQFKGRVVHSCNFRDPADMQGHKVCIVGAGPSGRDIAMEIVDFATEIYLSHPDPPIPFVSSVHQVGRISSLKSDSVVLNDGREIAIDTILFCTGYNYSYPFLSTECALHIDRRRVTPLYKHLIHTKFPTICFVGLCEYTLPHPHFHMQIQFFLATLDGSMVLPCQEDMDADTRADYERRLEEGMPHHHAHHMGPVKFREYETDLAKLAHFQPLRPVIFDMLDHLCDRYLNDYPNFKNDIYRVIDDEKFECKKA